MSLEAINDRVYPLYMQIRNHLCDLIDNGLIQSGDRLPSEKELETMFYVSRITVRRALLELAAEGKILRIPGKGTFSLPQKIEPLPALTSFSENMRSQGFEPSYKDTVARLVRPPARIEKFFFQSKPVDKVLHITRTLMADGIPMALQNAFLTKSVYIANPRLFSVDVLNNYSMYSILEQNLRIKLARAEEQVDASRATADEAEQLEIKRGDLVLVVTRLTYSEVNKPIEYVKLVFRADRYRYRVEMLRPSKKAVQ